MSWLLPETKPKQPLWYEDSNALRDVKAMDNAKRPYNLSPMQTNLAINSGRILNMAFVASTILAAPAALAWGTPFTLFCLAAGIGIQMRKRVKMGKSLKSHFDNAAQAPAAVQALAENAFDRAGLDKTGLTTLILKSNGQVSEGLAKQLPYTMAIIPEKKQLMIGEKTMESLSKDQLFSIICHETGHVVNRHKWATGQSLTETGIASGMMLMGLASLFTLNFVSAGYYIGASMASTLGRAYIKKLDEYRADRTGVLLSEKPNALASGITEISNNLFMGVTNNNPVKARELEKLNSKLSMFAKHPTNENRSRYIRQIAYQHSISPA